MIVVMEVEELGHVVEALGQHENSSGKWEPLFDRLVEELAKQIEIESMDFDDCAGGACRL